MHLSSHPRPTRVLRFLLSLVTREFFKASYEIPRDLHFIAFVGSMSFHVLSMTFRVFLSLTQAKRHSNAAAGNIATQVGMMSAGQPPLEAAPTPQGYAQRQSMGHNQNQNLGSGLVEGGVEPRNRVVLISRCVSLRRTLSPALMMYRGSWCVLGFALLVAVVLRCR